MWIKIFLDYLKFERGYSDRTIEGYQTGLEEFKRFCENRHDEFSWTNVDADIVREWILEMMGDGKSAGTVNFRLSSLRSFFKFLLRRKMLEKDPVHNIQGPKKEKHLPTYLRESEMNLLLDGEGIFPKSYSGERDRMILLMFYSTGIRLSELTGLDRKDIGLDEMQLKVTGKRDKQRVIPYGDELGDAIRFYLGVLGDFCKGRPSDGDAFFLDEKTGCRIKPAKVQSIVRRYLSLVTTQRKKSPHVLRHTFATTMLNNNADLQSVKELLGHESLSTTEIYTHTTFQELKEMYNQAHPRAK